MLWLRGSWNKTCVKYAVSGRHGNNLDSAKWHKEKCHPGDFVKRTARKKTVFLFSFLVKLSFECLVGILMFSYYYVYEPLRPNSKPLQLCSRQSGAIKRLRFFSCRKKMDSPPPTAFSMQFYDLGDIGYPRPTDISNIKEHNSCPKCPLWSVK